MKTKCKVLLCLLIGLSLLSQSCTFFLMKGKGPFEYNEIKAYLPALSDEEIKKYRSLPDESVIHIKLFGYRIEQIFPLGKSHWNNEYRKSKLIPGYQLEDVWRNVPVNASSHKHPVLDIAKQTNGNILIGLWYMAGTGVEYDLENGVSFNKGQYHTILYGLLFGSSWEISPIGMKRGFSKYDWQTPVNELQYNKKEGWILLGGVFGTGKVNGKKYMQIIWIPISLGDAE